MVLGQTISILFKDPIAQRRLPRIETGPGSRHTRFVHTCRAPISAPAGKHTHLRPSARRGRQECLNSFRAKAVETHRRVLRFGIGELDFAIGAANEIRDGDPVGIRQIQAGLDDHRDIRGTHDRKTELARVNANHAVVRYDVRVP